MASASENQTGVISHMKHHHGSGLTPVELLVIIFVLGTLYALTTPSLSRAQPASSSRVCMSKIRSLPAMIRAYAASWNGWTPPDPDYYFKLRGYAFKGEDGYQQDRAPQVKDFVCPVDDMPGLTRHGYPSSYFLMPVSVGQNLMQLTGPGNQIVAAKERRRVHPAPGPKNAYLAHYVYMDGSATLGGPVPDLTPE
jgi:hypothetical protein